MPKLDLTDEQRRVLQNESAAALRHLLMKEIVTNCFIAAMISFVAGPSMIVLLRKWYVLAAWAVIPAIGIGFTCSSIDHPLLPVDTEFPTPRNAVVLVVVHVLTVAVIGVLWHTLVG